MGEYFQILAAMVSVCGLLHYDGSRELDVVRIWSHYIGLVMHCMRTHLAHMIDDAILEEDACGSAC